MPSVVEVVTVKLPFSSIAFEVIEIKPADEMPAMVLTVPTVNVELLATVSDAIPVAAIVLKLFEVFDSV